MKGYKVFNNDWRCIDFQYEVGEEYKIEGELKICENGFHFCKKLVDCFAYYDFDPNNKVAEVEALGEVKNENNKSVTSHIKIVKELTWYEVLNMVNTGERNSGYSNSGYSNSGNFNTGSCNSGNYNLGNLNSGHNNSGNYNSGNHNSGYYNSGDFNSGYRNSKDYNSGDYNSGNHNSGNHNSGYGNSGYFNSGDRNTGNYNTGYNNSGHWNSGCYNDGDENSGHCNTGDYNVGIFNTEASHIKIFNKESDMTLKEFEDSEAWNLITRIKITEWFYASEMTDEEKIKYPKYERTNGYLKEYTLREAYKNWWDKLNEKQKEIIQNIPNFDNDIFYEITGISIEED